MPMPLSSDKLHLTMTKSSTFSGLRDALLAVTTFPAAENTLSDFELAAGTGKTILTRCERSVKYTLQLSWFTLPKTRPEPDPEPGLLTITRPEPDPKSKSATRQALHALHSALHSIYADALQRSGLPGGISLCIEAWSNLALVFSQQCSLVSNVGPTVQCRSGQWWAYFVHSTLSDYEAKIFRGQTEAMPSIVHQHHWRF